MGSQKRLGFWTSLRASVTLFAVVMAALLVALQTFGPAIGVTRDSGLWIWAGVGVALIAVLFGPRFAQQVGVRRAWLIGGLTFAASVCVYLYVAKVMVPVAIERASRAGAVRL